MSAGLTPRQAKALAFIGAHHAERGHAPSYDEIAAHLGLASKSNVCRLVQALEERGAIRRLRGRGRSIAPVRADATLLVGPAILARLRAAARAERRTLDDLLGRALAAYLAAPDASPVTDRDPKVPASSLPRDRLVPGSPADPARPGGR